jgi:LysM repeat protein
MKRNVRPYIIVVLLVIVALLSAACQRERPVPEETTGWDVSPIVQPTGPAVSATAIVQPSPNATTVSIDGSQPGAGTPEIITLPTSASAATTPTSGVVVPSVPTTAYTVQSGDTLFAIALQFNTDVETLRRLNNLSDDSLQIGQVLQVPDTGQGQQAGAAPQPTQAAAGEQVTYVVTSGDTLSAIAARFGVSWTEIAAANSIPAPYTIYRGQKLVIPGVIATPTPATPVRTHTVQAGETLYSIAVQYGVTVQTIMQANNLSNPDLIRTGQVLEIPGQ